MLFLYSLVASGSVAFAHLLFVVLLLVPARGAESANGDCGIPLGDAEPKVTDCLFVLRAAVQLEQCAPCVCDVNDSGGITASDALLCLRFAVGQDVVLTCPECVIVQCPGFVEWTTHAGIGGTCATDDQCVAGNCDHEIGRCRTATELDLGWKGTAHDVDLNEGSVLRLLVGCEGNAAGCGECEIQGVDAQGGSCRCANDSRVICDSPFAADAAACPACSGGAFAGMACAADAQCEGGPSGVLRRRVRGNGLRCRRAVRRRALCQALRLRPGARLFDERGLPARPEALRRRSPVWKRRRGILRGGRRLHRNLHGCGDVRVL